MERIKQAIENAKKPDLSGDSKPGKINQNGQHERTQRAPKTQSGLRNTYKMIISVVLIFMAGWLWLRLDFMNQLELLASGYIHDGITQARAEAKKRLADEEQYKQLIFDNLTHCQAAAENNRESYVKLVRDAVRIKNEKAVQDKQVIFILPKAAENKADMMLEAAKAECQKIYDGQLKNGK